MSIIIHTFYASRLFVHAHVQLAAYMVEEGGVCVASGDGHGCWLEQHDEEIHVCGWGLVLGQLLRLRPGKTSTWRHCNVPGAPGLAPTLFA